MTEVPYDCYSCARLDLLDLLDLQPMHRAHKDWPGMSSIARQRFCATWGLYLEKKVSADISRKSSYNINSQLLFGNVQIQPFSKALLVPRIDRNHEDSAAC